MKLKAMLQGPVNQHWGSCKGRGWGTEYHGFLVVEGQLEKKNALAVQFLLNALCATEP